MVLLYDRMELKIVNSYCCIWSLEEQDDGGIQYLICTSYIIYTNKFIQFQMKMQLHYNEGGNLVFVVFNDTCSASS